MALKGIAHFYKETKKHIITCQTDHKCVLDSARALQQEGFEVTYLPVQKSGLVDLERLKARFFFLLLFPSTFSPLRTRPLSSTQRRARRSYAELLVCTLAGGDPPGHGARVHHVREQRDWRPAAHCRDREDLPRTEGALSA